MCRTKYIFNFFLIFCMFIPISDATLDPDILNGLLHKLHFKRQEFGQLAKGAINFINGQWVATVNCIYDYNKDVDASWHYQEVIGNDITTLRRIDPLNKRDNEFIEVVGNENQVTSTLKITDFKAENVGLYNCMFAQPFDFFNQTFLLDSAPIIDGGSSLEISVEQDEDVTVTCSSFMNSHLYWRLPFLSDAYNPTITTSDDGISSITTLTFTAYTNHTSDFYQCCSKRNDTYLDETEIDSGLSEQCATFSIKVNGPPISSMDVKCLTETECILSCFFYSSSLVNPDSVSWSNCDLNGDNCQIIDQAEFSIRKIGQYSVETILVANYISSLPYYTCTANNDNFLSSTSTLINNAGEFSPLYNYDQSMALVKNETGGFSAQMICSFTSAPFPDIYWIKRELSGESLGLVILSEDDYDIQKTTLTTLDTISTLKIADYKSSDIASYMCVAVNEMGVEFGEFFEAKIAVREVEITAPGSTDINSEETSEIQCQAQSFPPPIIVWNTIAEFEIDFETSTVANWATGISTSVITFTPDKSNNFVEFQCLAYNEFLINETKSQQLSFSINHEPLIISIHSCNQSDFESGSSCILSCDLQTSYQAILLDWQWRYYINSPNEFVPFTEGTSIDVISPYRFRMELNLSDYNAFNYQYWSQFFYNTSGNSDYTYPTNTFKISSENEYIGLGSECTESEQCGTLNAVCSEQLCQCIEPYYIPTDEINNTTLACLSAVNPGENCVISKQCADGHKNYYCYKNNTCQCGGIKMTIANINLEECIKKASYNDPCDYNEECLLGDPETYCLSGRCSCIADFYYDTYSLTCVYDSGSMSTVAIVVISISTCIVVVIIFTLIAGYFRGRRTKFGNNNNMARNRSEVISEISGVPYEHLDDSSAVSQSRAAESVSMQPTRKSYHKSDVKDYESSSSSAHIEVDGSSKGSTHNDNPSNTIKFY